MATNKESFLLALKSTIDKIVHTKSVEIAVGCTDLDDNTQTPKLFSTENSALLLEFGSLVDDPRDPLYSGNFHVGARTVDDPANYEILELVGVVSSLFVPGVRIEIREEFDLVEGPLVGVLTPTEIDVLQQNYDLMSNMRLVNVSFKAQRLVV
jgi:hypothetical protein